MYFILPSWCSSFPSSPSRVPHPGPRCFCCWVHTHISTGCWRTIIPHVCAYVVYSLWPACLPRRRDLLLNNCPHPCHPSFLINLTREGTGQHRQDHPLCRIFPCSLFDYLHLAYFDFAIAHPCHLYPAISPWSYPSAISPPPLPVHSLLWSHHNCRQTSAGVPILLLRCQIEAVGALGRDQQPSRSSRDALWTHTIRPHCPCHTAHCTT
ncbi:hypothetical protein CC78DRAFT_276754 [Lojkania enalia]|uniref:Uncharacterized protein n=1 Tax=Lojkania enalia TaxID=147567 RepID=A0A9P4N812_9PLEO|nr:hypothetical protein CC78DRAFT_276754 [Didymosphaeria enalia]